jgi:hypothetical protein
MNIVIASEMICRTINEQKREGEDVWLLCSGCDRISPTDAATSIESLVEHVMFDHVARAELIIQRQAVLIPEYELAWHLSLEPRTEHEARWRKTRADQMVTPDEMVQMFGDFGPCASGGRHLKTARHSADMCRVITPDIEA